MEEQQSPIIFDIGSQTTKAGISGEDSPRITIPTIIGKIRREIVMPGMGQKEMYIGEEIETLQGDLTLSHPVQRGIVTNWEEVEKLLYHLYYNELRVAPEEQPTLLTEATRNPKKNSSKMIELMLETFSVPQTQLVNPGVLVLYGSGKLTGLVVESGDGVTQIVPIHEGLLTSSAIQRYQFGGNDITSKFVELLTESGIYFSSSTELEVAREMKEKMCIVNEDRQNDSQNRQKSGSEMKYTLPDGNEITLESERWRSTEVLFDPSLVGYELPGLHEMINLSIMKCDSSLKKLFWKNIILSGGNTLFSGIDNRLKNELNGIVKKNTEIDVYCVKERRYLSWIGGSVLASLSTFKDQWVTKEEYHEFGIDIKLKKCYF